MRWFWAFIALLVAGGLWFTFGPSSASTSPRTSTEPATASATRPATEPPANPTPNSPPPSAAAPTTATPQPPAPEIDLLGESGSIVAPKSELLADSRSPNDVIKRIDERTVELDGRYRVIGNGTAEDPYRISWELLTSAKPYIDPAQKALTPPPWVRAVDGTYIEISGYYSTAVRVTVAKSLLLTLNRWDGCCIGLPPTPFDAIDMSMRTPVPMQGLHLFRFGTFRGRLAVSAFETGGFLLGLYRLEDCTFETK